MTYAYAVAVGEQFDKIDFYGPFVEFDEAAAYGDRSGYNNWVVGLDPVESEGTTTLVIPKVDMELLKEQYERLQEVIAFVEEMRVTKPDIPDASILDGVVEMLGDQFELPAYVAHTCNDVAPTTVSECAACAAEAE